MRYDVNVTGTVEFTTLSGAGPADSLAAAKGVEVGRYQPFGFTTGQTCPHLFYFILLQGSMTGQTCPHIKLLSVLFCALHHRKELE